MADRPVTLRARWTPEPVTAGTFLAARTGGAIYRVLAAVVVREAGRLTPTHYRLTCARLAAADVPENATVRPWHADARPAARRASRGALTADPGPAEPHAARLARIRAKAPRFLDMAMKAIRQGRINEGLAAIARAARVGRDDGYADGHNYGPGIRLHPVRDRAGRVLREADTEIAEAADPDQPNRTVRRAYRSDPLTALLRAGTVTVDEVLAAEWLRDRLQAAQGSLSGGGQSEIHLAAHERIPITDQHVTAWGEARIAIAAIAWRNRSIVLWVTVGGTLRAHDRHAGLRNGASTARLRDGLAELAEHHQRVSGTRKPRRAA